MTKRSAKSAIDRKTPTIFTCLVLTFAYCYKVILRHSYTQIAKLLVLPTAMPPKTSPIVLTLGHGLNLGHGSLSDVAHSRLLVP